MQKKWGILLVILSAFGIIAGLYMNRFGVDVEPDSAVMMSAGILFAHGEGVSEPNLIGDAKAMTWFPPALPWMIAYCEKTGLDIRKAFAVFNAISWGLLTGWVGLLAYRVAGQKPLFGILAAAMILTSGAISYIHGMLYSEPPFLLWMTGSLAALAFWWERPLFRWAGVAALCAGAAVLTRYVGVTLGLTGGLLMLLRLSIAYRRRLGMLIVFSVLSLGPLFAWHLWQTNGRHAASERTLAWHPITLAQISEGVDTIVSFVVPEEFSKLPYSKAFILTAIALLMIAAAGLWLGRRNGKSILENLAATPPLVWISAGFMGIYVAFLIVSISIADAETPLDARILSILLPPGAIVVTYFVSLVSCQPNGRLTRWVTIAALSGLLILQEISTIRYQVMRADVTWSPNHPSELLKAVCAIPKNAMIFSNEPTSIYMATRRKSEGLPCPPPMNNSIAGKLNDFNQRMQILEKTMAPQGGWVVYWIQLNGDPVVSADIVTKTLPVQETMRFDDGVILRIAPQ